MPLTPDAIRLFRERPHGSEIAASVRVGGLWLWTARSRRGFLRRLFASKEAAEAEVSAIDGLDVTMTGIMRAEIYARDAGSINGATDWLFFVLEDLFGADVIVTVDPAHEVFWIGARSKQTMWERLREAATAVRERIGGGGGSTTPPGMR